MSLPDIDTLMKMNSDELDELLESEVEKLVNSAHVAKRQKLRAMHWNLRQRVKMAPTHVKGMMIASSAMWASFEELREQLNAFADVNN